MSRRGKIRLASYVIAVMLVLAAAVAACHVGAGTYTTQLDAQSSRAFGEAFSAAQRLERTLDACAFAADAPMQSALCTQLYSDANCFETALSSLPIQLDALEEISRHAAIMGDYAYLLSRVTAEGNPLSAETLSQLTIFSESIHLLTKGLSDLQQAYEQGDLVMEQRRRLTDSFDNLAEEVQKTVTTIDQSFHDLAASFPATEPFAYDGRFGAQEQRAAMLAGKAMVSQEEAIAIAADFSLCAPGDLQPLDCTEGEIPCWRSSIQKDAAVIAVTMQGGEVLSWISDCAEPGAADSDEVELIAQTFLEQHGYSDMERIESVPGGSTVSMTFVPVAEDVLCLPDRVTIKICPSTGKVTAFDASGYLKHHRARSFPDTAHTWTPPDSLTAETQRKVVILSPGGQERYCTEYLCRTQNGNAVRIAVNAETGLQEQILLGESRVQPTD